MPMAFVGRFIGEEVNFMIITFCRTKYNGAWLPGLRLNINTVLQGYSDSHIKDKTEARPSYR